MPAPAPPPTPSSPRSAWRRAPRRSSAPIQKAYPVYVDESMLGFDRVAVSAGKRGLMLWLAPQDYLTATEGRVGAIARHSP